MGACDGIYLYTDLDGTLLTDDKRISEEDAAAICEFVREGGRFGVATGRVPGIIGNVAKALPVNAPCILYNGAGLYHLGERRFLAMHPVDRRACARVTQEAIRLERNVCIQIFTDSAIYETNPDQRDDPCTVFERIATVKSTLNEVPDIFLKFVLSQSPERMNRLMQKLDLSHIGGGLSLFRSSDIYYEFVSEGINKGAALADVRSRCKNVKKILAIGDFENDLEMIELADVGGAPANAIASVKAAANIVLPVDNNHGAVARFLETAL